MASGYRSLVGFPEYDDGAMNFIKPGNSETRIGELFFSIYLIFFYYDGGTSCVCIHNVGYFVTRLYTTRIKCVITLSLQVSALLGHHQVTTVYNYDIKDIPIQRIRCYKIGVL
jgi:hypothetical protein